jgi:predicted transposase/invertase (TIGR01784 family)
MTPEQPTPRYVSMLSDYGFKATFGNQTNTDFLRKALQALINSPTPIQEVTFIQNEMHALTIDSRAGIYDVFCTDERGNQFIVEMQLGVYPEFIHRMKFYALYRLNTLIRRGEYKFEGLPKIYCIGILAKNIFPQIEAYHNIGTMKNDTGETMDDQTVFITVELAKFNKPLEHITSNLDKLLYLMKTVDTAKEPTQYPEFWTEEWLQIAIRELDTRIMTPEERMFYEIALVKNALVIQDEEAKLNAAKKEALEVAEKAERVAAEAKQAAAEAEQAVNAAEQRTQQAEQRTQQAEQRTQQAEQRTQQAVLKLLNMNVLSVSQIAETMEISEEDVLQIRRAAGYTS